MLKWGVVGDLLALVRDPVHVLPLLRRALGALDGPGWTLREPEAFIFDLEDPANEYDPTYYRIVWALEKRMLVVLHSHRSSGLGEGVACPACVVWLDTLALRAHDHVQRGARDPREALCYEITEAVRAVMAAHPPIIDSLT